MFRQSIPLTLRTHLKSQLPTSTYGMDLKLEEVLVVDRRRR